MTPRRAERFQPSTLAATAVASTSSSSPSSSSALSLPSSPWLCPACSSPLSRSEEGANKTLTCPQNHCYDLSKEGYVNLVRAGRKAKKSGAAPAGDAPEALAARGRFLAAGHFDRVMEAAADAVMEVLLRRKGEGREPGTTTTILDAGCGEGAYLRRLSHRLASSSFPSSSSSLSSSSISLLGVDVAKAAVRSAASRAQQREEEGQKSDKIGTHFAVASAFALPLPDSSVSCALVAFAPLPSAELRRVLIDDGEPGSAGSAVIVVGPGPKHFLGLKREVYGRERAEESRDELLLLEGGEGPSSSAAAAAAAAALPPFSSQARIQYRLSLDGPAAFDLLRMTPYWWRASEATREKVKEKGLETEVDVLVSVVERSELDLL